MEHIWSTGWSIYGVMNAALGGTLGGALNGALDRVYMEYMWSNWVKY